MATDYSYCCDVCGKKRKKHYPTYRKYTMMVRGVKITMFLSSTNHDELCDVCFEEAVRTMAVTTEYKEGRNKGDK